MNKRTKRLSLHRETLRNLQPAELSRAAGRGETWEIFTTCACTETCQTDWSCGCGTGSGGCGSQTACTTGQTWEIFSGCATNC